MDMIVPMEAGMPDGDGLPGGRSTGGGGRGSGRRDLSEDQFVFRSDGAFHDGGFTITPQGLTSAPDMLSRRDSDGSSVEGVPKSRHNVIHVASLNEFRKGQVLGSGANGTVYLTVHQTTRRHMAVKTVNVYDEEKRKQLLQELGALTRHVSRFLVRFYGAFYDGSGAVHIALEYMDCGALSDAIAVAGRVPEAVLNQVAVHCLRGLRFLHRNHVLHRDLKTANILLSRRLGRAKLSDFGLARDLHPGVSKADTFVGTMAYMSPERLQGERYTYASDVWGLGVSLAECSLGRYPFPKPQNFFDYIAAAHEDVLGGVSDFGPHSTSSGGGADDVVLSDDARDFLARCTAVDPADRPTACALLEHPWIRRRQREPTVFAEWCAGSAARSRRRARGPRASRNL
uniref:mitogen-activated protein kinase kinase n=1 Tax=Pyropia haitanensis TaxID=1262161 RepID=A0A1L5YF17_PYRHA|nr:mitogen-activated protein kinase kinase 1 [Neoporphyra haitanensis]